MRAVPSHGTFPWESHSHGQACQYRLIGWFSLKKASVLKLLCICLNLGPLGALLRRFDG